MDYMLVIIILFSGWVPVILVWLMGKQEAKNTRIWAEKMLEKSVNASVIAQVLRTPDPGDKLNRSPLEQIRDSVRDGVNGTIGNYIRHTKDELKDEVRKAAEEDPKMFGMMFLKDLIMPQKRKPRSRDPPIDVE